MKLFKSILPLAALALSLPAYSQQADPDKTAETAMVQIRSLQQKIRQAMQANVQPDPQIQADIRQTALDATKGIDPQKVALGKGKEWVEIFALAGNERGSALVAKRFYDQRSFELMDLSVRIVQSYISQGKFQEARRHIRFADFSAGPSMIGQFHAGLRSMLQAKAGTNLKDVLSIYDDIIDRLQFGDHISEGDKNWTPFAYADILSDKLTIIYKVGRKQEALKGFAKLQEDLKKYPKSVNAHGGGALGLVESKVQQLTAEANQTGLIGKPAPTLLVDQHLNEFTGLNDFKGKVIILDFMAHWCGPCKAALPSLAKLQDDLGSKGVQVVSLTSFYGYYGAKQGVGKDEEFNLMKSFIKEFKITWPLLFDSSGKNNFNFGVTGIPHLVVIDQKGIVRKIEVGFTPESFAETRKLIEKLAATDPLR